MTPQERREYFRAYREKHREKLNAKARERMGRNKEKLKAKRDTPEGKEKLRAYQASPAGKAAQKRYRSSAKGKRAIRRRRRAEILREGLQKHVGCRMRAERRFYDQLREIDEKVLGA